MEFKFPEFSIHSIYNNFKEVFVKNAVLIYDLFY